VTAGSARGATQTGSPGGRDCSYDRAMQMLFFRLSVLLFVAGPLTVPIAAEDFKRVARESFGKTPDGGEVTLITLRNAKGMKVEVISYGAIIKAVDAPDREGKLANVVLSADTIEQFVRGFNGAAAVIGRVANRIARALFDLEGVHYTLTPNERKNSIHGGRKGFAQSLWTVQAAPAKDGESAIRLIYVSKDGEEGFPGKLTTTVTYALTDKNELRLEYEAETNQPTIVNLTNHAYWNLAGGGSALDHVLSIPAEKYTPTDAELIPTGEIRPVDGTPLDFRKPTRIGDRIDQLKPGINGYDHNYILGDSHEMKMAARLMDPKSGRIMEVRTTQPAVQLYTANHLKHTAVCLETQHYPDAVHHDNFPSIVVRPGQPLQETTIFAFSAK
jgi:aldose 1-epimerase